MVNLLEHLAAKGRFGDSEIRMVNGEMSHVNPIEANIIDQYGAAGEYVTSQVGSGTINPETGMREHFLFGLGLAASIGLLGAGAGLIGGQIKGYQKTGKFDIRHAWDYSFGKRGLADFFSGGHYSKQREKERKIKSIQNNFDKGIGDFKELDFVNMNDNEKLEHLKTLLGPDADVTMDDVNRYYDKYDPTEELRTYRRGGEEIEDTGIATDRSLLQMYTSKRQADARADFAKTGNPMVDKQRQQIFTDTDRSNRRTWRGLLENVSDLHTGYNEQMVENAFGHETAITT